MPRVSREQTIKNRAAIEDVSSRLFREQGFKGVSVADLMAAAGLTHGGFYGHFSSKDALAGLACGKAFENSAQRWEQRISEHADPRAAFGAIVNAYLAPSSRDNAGDGCPAAALAGDVAREAQDMPARAAYLAGIKVLVEKLAALSHQSDPAACMDQALVQLATLAGALMLARATSGDPLSDHLLAAVRHFLNRGPAS